MIMVIAMMLTAMAATADDDVGGDAMVLMRAMRKAARRNSRILADLLLRKQLALNMCMNSCILKFF